jgi:Zn-dependent protease
LDHYDEHEVSEGQRPAEEPKREEQPLGGLRILRVAGINIYINYTWLFIVALVAWSLASGYFPATLPGRASVLYWGLGVVAAVLLFACVLIHELSHSLVAIREGLHISGITLFLFGGVSNLAERPPNPGSELRIALAGPGSSFLLSGIFFGALVLVPGPPALLAMLAYLALVNVLLGVFNIIPGFPLDGGRVLRALLWWRTRNLKRSTLLAATVGAVVGWAIVALGAMRFVFGDPVGGLWFVLIGLFLRSAANFSSARAERGQDV